MVRPPPDALAKLTFEQTETYLLPHLL